jgi:Zn-dependent protease with chaperone function
MLVIAFHEFGHAITACCTGGRVKSISLDPHEGGVTKMQGGISAITLPAGYLGSSLIGALLIFCGFDIVASKFASIVLAVCFLLTLWWARRDWLTIITVLFAVGLLVACWFIAHAEPLRFVVVSIHPIKVGEGQLTHAAFYRRYVCAVQRLGYCEIPPTPISHYTDQCP